MTISLLHPSRGRAQAAWQTANEWLFNSSTSIEHILSLDNDDPGLLAYQHIAWPIVVYNANKSVVEATNQAAKIATGDLLAYISDDVQSFPGWDTMILNIAAKYSGEFVIKPSDGLQRFENDMITFPIMSRPLYKSLGYFWHPDYKSMLVDVDLWHTCKRRGAVKLHPEITFKHSHPSNGTAPNDATYIRTHEHYPQGKAAFAKRQRASFR